MGRAHRIRCAHREGGTDQPRAHRARRRRGARRLHRLRRAHRVLQRQRGARAGCRAARLRRAGTRGDPAARQHERAGHGAGRDPAPEAVGRDRRAAPGLSGAAQEMSQLAARGLKKRYKAREVVKDVSFEVANGEVVGLLGPNGAGKTTCFYMVVGLVGADAGTITIGGENVTSRPMHRRARLGLSYLPQEASVFRKLTVEENIRAVLELQNLPPTRVDERLAQLLDELNITGLRENPALSLSGGERRRVEIARALAADPKFILLDEPFAGVDPIAVLDIQKIIRFLKERSIGVLITDHNVRETLGICDRAYIISEGRVLAAGAPAEIVENENVRRVYLGEHFRL
ncbi:MAG: LPS export ABC transporter ATP-binding protein [Burkholderiales bacterium]|nr:LPS export ABC transporter ATP-binding protein [Burkholderiales bacterium]